MTFRSISPLLVFCYYSRKLILSRVMEGRKCPQSDKSFYTINTNLMKQVGSDARASYNKTMDDSYMNTDFSEAGGARSLGATGEVLSRKDRLQVQCFNKYIVTQACPCR